MSKEQSSDETLSGFQNGIDVQFLEARLTRQDSIMRKLLEEQDRLNEIVANWERKITDRDWDEIKIEQSIFEKLKKRTWVMTGSGDEHYDY